MQEIGNNTIIKKPRLTIRIGQQSLSFSAVNTAQANRIVFEPYTVKSGISMAANLREAFKEIDLQRSGWQRAMVLIDSPVLMMPVDEFNENNKETLYNHAITDHQNDAILSTVLPSLNAVAVYSINKDLKLVIDDNFSDVRFLHVCVPVWNHFYRRSFTGVRQKLYVYFHDKKFDVFCFQQNRFKFTNSFNSDLAPDVVYFVLNIWKQLAFDNKRDELHLVGTLPDKENLVQELRSFIQNVYVINPKAEFNRSPITEIKDLPYDLMTYFVKG
ncbi:MAG: DUF3822 family protein [Prevotellaceae bacterium]|nr:DUF3822 family protein [Prevotellaceae bacterium]